MNQISRRYQGEKGLEYFADAGRFSGDQDLGRLWQSRYFISYCASHETILDFGCGDGTILRALPAGRRLGVEVNPYCLERIIGFNANLAVPIEVEEDIGSWGEAIADVAISNHALEHLLQPFEALRGIYRVLRPGGAFILVTPYDDWRGKGQSTWDSDDAQNHLYTWNPRNIGNLLTEAGFVVQSVRLVSSAWSPKIFWVHRYFGTAVFAAACSILARVLQRREILTVAVRPIEGS